MGSTRPAQLSVGDVRFGAGGRERRRVDAVVDRADELRVRAAALLPQPVVAIAGGDQGGHAVRLLGEQPEEAEHQRLHRPAVGPGAVAEVALAQIHAVLGEQQRYAVQLAGGQTGQGGECRR